MLGFPNSYFFIGYGHAKSRGMDDEGAALFAHRYLRFVLWKIGFRPARVLN